MPRGEETLARDAREFIPETRDPRADIYATCVQMSGTQVQDTILSEVSTADLNDQVNQERLSFIHSQVFTRCPKKVFVYVLILLLVNEHFFGTPCTFQI